MMNATVARIVELMFEDLEMSDEVQAIHDEVMNNCQERFDDLVACGMSEDEATAAVVESLKGMDEVLAAYPKKKTGATVEIDLDASDDSEDDKDSEPRKYAFSPDMVRTMVVETLSHNVEISESDDGMVHVECESEDIEVTLADGRLGIKYRGDGVQRTGKNSTAKMHAKGFHIDMEEGFDLRTLFDKISVSLREMSENMHIKIGLDDTVEIKVPSDLYLESVHIATTSGDVEIRSMDDLLHARRVTITSASGDVTLENNIIEELSINSTSGDIEINNEEHHTMRSLRVRTTSGEIEGEIYTDSCEMNTISGDMDLEGRYGALTVGSTSGDVTVRADVRQMRFRSVSGDMELNFDSREIESIQGQTVSGDVDVRLPGGMTVSEFKTHSTSGDSNCSVSHGSGENSVRININTVSGDIDVR